MSEEWRPESRVSELTKAVCAVMAAVRYVPETGRNQFHRYSYASDEDLLTVLQPAMAANGLALIPSRTDVRTVEHSPDGKGKAQWRTEVVVTYRLLHTSGESVEVQAPGCGIDGEDKGAYKAMTGALKYALRHTFLVPTGQDAERAAEESRKSRRAEPRPAPEPPAKREHHPSWDDARAFFCARLRDHGVSYDRLADYLASKGRPRPSQVDSDVRSKMLAWVASADGRSALGLDARDRDQVREQIARCEADLTSEQIIEAIRRARVDSDSEGRAYLATAEDAQRYLVAVRDLVPV